MISIKDLTVAFDDKIILDSVSMEIGEGEFVGILGPNGAGKTTLVKSILGLIKPTKGSIKIDNLDIKEYLDKKYSSIGYLPQHAIVNWNMPIRVIDAVLIEKIKPFGLFRKYSKDEVASVAYWLSVFGVEDKMYNYIRELSGGQQQRVSLARCMIHNPKILILDEPNTAIDAVYNTKLYKVLKELSQKNNITIIMVSHDIGAVTTYVDEVMCLNIKLHCHGKSANIDISKVLKEVYGEGMEVVVHGDGCQNCVLNKVSK
jgi:zinc transport system ATP-binding protein